MKKISLCLVAAYLMASLFTGCGGSAPAEPATTTAPAETAAATEAPTIETTAATEAPTVETVETTAPALVGPSEYVDAAYAEVIGRYATALTEQWSEDKYFDNGMSALPVYYYEGNVLENVGFGYLDLNCDGQNELLIGAIQDADRDPSVFEIWTIANGEPVMLAQGSTGDHYVLQFVPEDNVWYVVREASNSAASFATYYMMLSENGLEVTQGILFDAMADEANPWFMTYDLDWDASNDEPIDEDMANAIMDNNRKYYTVADYFPFTCYN